jgi:SAM-dependent methyltransferase
MCLDIRRRPGAAIVGDAHWLPFADECLDMILSTEVLEHTLEPQRIVDEIRRVLRPGGRVLLTTRFIFPLHDVPGDYYRFTNYALSHLFRGWSSVQVDAEATTLETVGILLHRMTMQAELRAQRLVRPVLLLAAKLIGRLGWLMVRQYGDGARSRPVPDMLVSGWHVTATK